MVAGFQFTRCWCSHFSLSPIVTLIVYPFNGAGVEDSPTRLDFRLVFLSTFPDDAILAVSPEQFLGSHGAAVVIALGLGIPAALVLDPGKLSWKTSIPQAGIFCR